MFIPFFLSPSPTAFLLPCKDEHITLMAREETSRKGHCVKDERVYTAHMKERVGHRFPTFLENACLTASAPSPSPYALRSPFFPNLSRNPSATSGRRARRGGRAAARCTSDVGRRVRQDRLQFLRPAAVHSDRYVSACERERR